MTKDKMRQYIILAVILIVFSVLAFAVPFSMTSIFWIAYVFGVLAILFQVYVLHISSTEEGDIRSKFYGYPIARVGMIYLFTQIVISVVEMAFASFLPAWITILINIILTALAVIGCVATEAMRDEIVRQDTRLKKNIQNMRNLQSFSVKIMDQCEDLDLKEKLQVVADEFKYSDPVSSEETELLEADLQQKLQDIQDAILEGDNSAAMILCSKLIEDLHERNRICAMSK